MREVERERGVKRERRVSFYYIAKSAKFTVHFGRRKALIAILRDANTHWHREIFIYVRNAYKMPQNERQYTLLSYYWWLRMNKIGLFFRGCYCCCCCCCFNTIAAAAVVSMREWAYPLLRYWFHLRFCWSISIYYKSQFWAFGYCTDRSRRHCTSHNNPRDHYFTWFNVVCNMLMPINETRPN